MRPEPETVKLLIVIVLEEPLEVVESMLIVLGDRLIAPLVIRIDSALVGGAPVDQFEPTSHLPPLRDDHELTGAPSTEWISIMPIAMDTPRDRKECHIVFIIPFSSRPVATQLRPAFLRKPVEQRLLDLSRKMQATANFDRKKRIVSFWIPAYRVGR